MGLAEPILNAEGAPGGPRDLLGGRGGPFLILLQAQFNHLPQGRLVMGEIWAPR